MAEHWFVMKPGATRAERVKDIEVFRRELPDDEHDALCDLSPGEEFATKLGVVSREADTCDTCGDECDAGGYCSCRPKCRRKGCDQVATEPGGRARSGRPVYCRECDEGMREDAEEARAEARREEGYRW